MKDRAISAFIRLAERGRVPEWLLRWGMHRLCDARLSRLDAADVEQQQEASHRFQVDSVRGPVALVPEKANEQHYEVPAEFFAKVLGPHRKYSSCYWEPGCESLEQAERRSLELTCEHADLVDGQSVLELGCGWGSLTLWMLRRYPSLRVTAVSNSGSQRASILERARREGLADRLQVVTADMNDFDTTERFDRIVSVEMFEHMRNFQLLLRRAARWLEPDGVMLVHVFCHRRFCYPFEEQGAANWMGQYFFSGGIMPSDDWLLRFQDDLVVTRQWRWSGTHYRRTAEAWLRNMSDRRGELLEILAQVYPGQSPRVWYHRWRMLFLAGAVLFGARRGREWYVSHYRFEPVAGRLQPRADSEFEAFSDEGRLERGSLVPADAASLD